MMKFNRLQIIICFFIFLSSCEETTEPDTTAPTVTITYPQSGSTVSEIVSVTCISTDNDGVEKVELWVDGASTNVFDNSEPYSLEWNTTTYDDGTSHTITIRSYDNSGNKADSEPITLIVDNSGSYPNPISIGSITFSNGSFTITWNQSTDGDFGSYKLEKSIESTMSDYEVLHSTENIADTTYIDNDVDPLIYQYYRISVIDTLGYETKGQITSSSLDPIPTTVNVTSVTYTLDEMTVEWEESTDGDFKDYKLLYSVTASGDKDTLAIYEDISTTSHSNSDFDPTHENWFWVMVNDTLGQFSIGNGLTNTIDSPPTQVVLNPIVFQNNSFSITWSQSIDNDFKSYKLYESLSEDMSSQTLLYETNNLNDTSFVVTGVNENEIRYYQLLVTDFFNLETLSTIVMGNPYLIVYVYNNDIYLMDVNGNNQTNLTNNPSSYSKPQFSPDGSKILFIEGNYNNSAIRLINIDSGNLTTVISDEERLDSQPQFSPDGFKIVFHSYRITGNPNENEREIKIVDIDGNNLTVLSDSDVERNLYPSFSPDGSKIIYYSASSDGAGNYDYEIYIMNVDGSDKTNLSNDDSYDDRYPKFTPDGSKILFLKQLQYERDRFTVMNIDGSNENDLTTVYQMLDYDIPLYSFSPDGSTIVFSGRSNNEYYIHLMDLSGGTTVLTNNIGGSSMSPSFSPNGSKILFKSWDGIYIMNIDGIGVLNISYGEGLNYPRFQPRQ